MDEKQFEIHAALEDSHWWFLARRAIIGKLVQGLLPADKAHKVVDIGCGTGADIASLASSYQCLGIDPSEHAVRLARKRFPHIEFVHGTVAESAADRLAEADLVLLLDVMEHVEDDFALLSGVLQLMKPQAKLLLTVPSDLALWSRHDEVYGHFRRYDRTRLEATWSELPVRCHFLSHFNTRLYPLIRWIRRLQHPTPQAGQRLDADLQRSGRLTNSILKWIFSGEGRHLTRALGGDQVPYRRGVSLIAVLVRQAGVMQVRRKPIDLPPDRYLPKAAC